MTHAFIAEAMVLFCPRCHCQHEDFGEWATRPHSKHRCMFCKNEWRPFPFTTVGVPLATRPNCWPGLIVPFVIFEGMSEYSSTVPTGPIPGLYWRCRRPYRGEDRTSLQYLGLAIELPNDPPGEISLIWRRLYVAEWIAADALAAALGVAA